ncbi:uncharacterized protein SAPINGB_P002476 [Magnusiomyces paraingens]|uniref:Reverse transcriptase Ty1/copia-type domain-containing protein n=1 Tax=Magnusiomyces paraingens TaxID=2606893 RepID=A0A5E8BE46_9ASCO|nr:uncharacterized protein SAPINGB_P002476 [Saprochaete ingens]VVT49853.1 unnamed protein product [Saprochaete ingens]
MVQLDKYKARLVVQGFSSKFGVDYVDTFAPVMRFSTVRLIFALSAAKFFSAMSNHGNTTGVNEGPSSFESASTGSSVAHSTSETHSKNNASSYETFARSPVHRQIDLADRSDLPLDN